MTFKNIFLTSIAVTTITGMHAKASETISLPPDEKKAIIESQLESTSRPKNENDVGISTPQRLWPKLVSASDAFIPPQNYFLEERKWVERELLGSLNWKLPGFEYFIQKTPNFSYGTVLGEDNETFFTLLEDRKFGIFAQQLEFYKNMLVDNIFYSIGVGGFKSSSLASQLNATMIVEMPQMTLGAGLIDYKDARNENENFFEPRGFAMFELPHNIIVGGGLGQFQTINLVYGLYNDFGGEANFFGNLNSTDFYQTGEIRHRSEFGLISFNEFPSMLYHATSIDGRSTSINNPYSKILGAPWYPELTLDDEKDKELFTLKSYKRQMDPLRVGVDLDFYPVPDENQNITGAKILVPSFDISWDSTRLEKGELLLNNQFKQNTMILQGYFARAGISLLPDAKVYFAEFGIHGFPMQQIQTLSIKGSYYDSPEEPQGAVELNLSAFNF